VCAFVLACSYVFVKDINFPAGDEVAECRGMVCICTRARKRERTGKRDVPTDTEFVGVWQCEYVLVQGVEGREKGRGRKL